eukprot:contig_17393_g4246
MPAPGVDSAASAAMSSGLNGVGATPAVSPAAALNDYADALGLFDGTPPTAGGGGGDGEALQNIEQVVGGGALGLGDAVSGGAAANGSGDLSSLGLGDVPGMGGLGDSNEANLRFLMSVVDADVGEFLA